MCYIPVNLPTVTSFLMLYSLRCGCIVIWAWTLLRSLSFISFFLVTLVLMYMPDSKHTASRPADENFFCVFLSYIIMIVTECFVFIFGFYLGVGLYYDSSFHVQQYLICRFPALILEIIALIILSFQHEFYIGWYLVFLMIIFLEFYSFIVVYSYYVDIELENVVKECEDAQCENYINYKTLPETRNSRDTPESRDTRTSRNTPPACVA